MDNLEFNRPQAQIQTTSCCKISFDTPGGASKVAKYSLLNHMQIASVKDATITVSANSISLRREGDLWLFCCMVAFDTH